MLMFNTEYNLLTTRIQEQILNNNLTKTKKKFVDAYLIIKIES